MIDIQRKFDINEMSNFITEVKKYIKNSMDKLNEIENSLENKKGKFIVDRFEGEFAVCESINDKKIVNIEKEKLPIDIKEGMVLNYTNDKYMVDQKESNDLKSNIDEIVQNLWEN